MIDPEFALASLLLGLALVMAACALAVAVAALNRGEPSR